MSLCRSAISNSRQALDLCRTGLRHGSHLTITLHAFLARKTRIAARTLRPQRGRCQRAQLLLQAGHLPLHPTTETQLNNPPPRLGWDLVSAHVYKPPIHHLQEWGVCNRTSPKPLRVVLHQHQKKTLMCAAAPLCRSAGAPTFPAWTVWTLRRHAQPPRSAARPIASGSREHAQAFHLGLQPGGSVGANAPTKALHEGVRVARSSAPRPTRQWGGHIPWCRFGWELRRKDTSLLRTLSAVVQSSTG